MYQPKVGETVYVTSIWLVEKSHVISKAVSISEIDCPDGCLRVNDREEYWGTANAYETPEAAAAAGRAHARAIADRIMADAQRQAAVFLALAEGGEG